MSREEEKPNYMIVIGDKDQEEKTVSVRSRKFENGKKMQKTTSQVLLINQIQK